MAVKIEASDSTKISFMKRRKTCPMLTITSPSSDMAFLCVSLFYMRLTDTGSSSVSIVSHHWGSTHLLYLL
jgi:hypothetical protein